MKISFSLPKFSKKKKLFCPFRRPPFEKKKEKKRTCQGSPIGPAGRRGRYKEKRRWAGPTTIERVSVRSQLRCKPRASWGKRACQREAGTAEPRAAMRYALLAHRAEAAAPAPSAARRMLQAAVSLCYDLRCKERGEERRRRKRERTGACELRNCKTENSGTTGIDFSQLTQITEM